MRLQSGQLWAMLIPVDKLFGILYLGNFLSSRGGSRQPCEELVPRFQSRGWQLITASIVRNRTGRLIDMLWTVWHRRNDYEVAVIDLFSGFSFVWAELTSRLLKFLNKRLVVVMHGGGLPEFAAKHPRHIRGLLARADRVLSPSKYLSEQMATYAKGIELLPNGIELSAYTPKDSAYVSPKLVWLRAFCQIYNPTLAVDVAARLKPEFPQLHLTMVGPDKDGSLAVVQTRAHELGVADCLELPGGVPKSEVPGWLSRGDIFINTTNVDNMPVSVIEAMACGMCVVSTNVGGLSYLLEHEVDALLVPPNDAEAMAAAVRRLLTELSLAEKLSRNARAKAEQFDWSNVLPQWERLFVKLAEG